MPDYSVFPFRMPAGFPGDTNRAHPFSIEPGLNDATNPVPFVGSAVVGNTAANSYRGILASDSAITTISGIAVRAYPIAAPTASGNFAAVAFGGLIAPPLGGIDILKYGYIMVPVLGTPTKFGAVFLWFAASSGLHVQGGFEATATGGSTAALTNVKFNGPADTFGICEVILTQV